MRSSSGNPFRFDENTVKILRRLNRLASRLNRLPGRRARDLPALSSRLMEEIVKARQEAQAPGKTAAYRSALAQARQARYLLQQAGPEFFLSPAHQSQLRQDLHALTGLLAGILRLLESRERRTRGRSAISLCIRDEPDIIGQRRKRDRKTPCRTKKSDNQK